jgi:hypothetical protein
MWLVAGVVEGIEIPAMQKYKLRNMYYCYMKEGEEKDVGRICHLSATFVRGV